MIMHSALITTKSRKAFADVKDGDTVTVTYTGTVDEVDAFDGTVLSVKKAKYLSPYGCHVPHGSHSNT